jgi:DNA repair protein SbcD/Mre11
VDLFLFCGDAYRTADPTPTQQRLFAECLKPVADAGIPIAMVIGNHDHPVTFGKASAVDIFGFLLAGRRPRVPQAGGRRIETKAGPLQLIALPWPIRSLVLSKDEHRGKTPEEIRDYIEGLYADYARRQAEALDPALPAVLAAHLTVEGAEIGGSERTSLIAHEPKFTVGQLAHPSLDYVALGHIHKFQDRNREAYERGEGPPVVYSSSIERISFKEHDAQKGFVLVDIEAPPGRPQEDDLPVRRDAGAAVRPHGGRHRPRPRGPHRPPSSPVDQAAGRLRGRRARPLRGERGAARHSWTRAPSTTPSPRRTPSPPSSAIVEAAERKRTTFVRREASLQEALTQYIQQKEELHPMQDALLAAAAQLEAEIDGRADDA